MNKLQPQIRCFVSISLMFIYLSSFTQSYDTIIKDPKHDLIRFKIPHFKLRIGSLNWHPYAPNKGNDSLNTRIQKNHSTIVEEKIYKKHFLWRENTFNKEIKDSISETTINKSYIQSIPEDEKAAIAFVLTFIDNACNWENGDPNPERNNLICKGLTALGFTYQCSDKHISFLNEWFKYDSISLRKIKLCPHSFPGITVTTSLKSLNLERNKDTITIYAKIIGSNTRVQRKSEWINTYTFISKDNVIFLEKENLHQKIKTTKP